MWYLGPAQFIARDYHAFKTRKIYESPLKAAQGPIIPVPGTIKLNRPNHSPAWACLQNFSPNEQILWLWGLKGKYRFIRGNTCTIIILTTVPGITGFSFRDLAGLPVARVLMRRCTHYTVQNVYTVTWATVERT